MGNSRYWRTASIPYLRRPAGKPYQRPAQRLEVRLGGDGYQPGEPAFANGAAGKIYLCGCGVDFALERLLHHSMMGDQSP
jgi:hypothetical protein